MGKATRIAALLRVVSRFLGVCDPLHAWMCFVRKQRRSRPWTTECRPRRNAYALRLRDKRFGSDLKAMSEEAGEQNRRIDGGARGAKGLGDEESGHSRQGGIAAPRGIGRWTGLKCVKRQRGIARCGSTICCTMCRCRVWSGRIERSGRMRPRIWRSIRETKNTLKS